MTKITVTCLQLEALELVQAEQALEQALVSIDKAAEQEPDLDLIVLPECTYPAYYLHSVAQYHEADLRPHGEVVKLFGERARRHNCHISVGLAQPLSGSERLLNASYLFDARGEVLGTYAKSFLWHFDQYWFDNGRQFPTFDLPSGRLGIFVCADGRMPEIARVLGVKQARLLVDNTAWVSGGGDRQTLNNPQFQYMVPTRAVENGAWIVVANKVGVEAETVVYCGRSCIISPLGQHVVQASTDRPEIITAEIDLDVASGPPEWRRPELYGVLGQPVDQLPVTDLLQEAVVPVDSIVRIGALQLKPYTSAQAFLERVTKLCGILAKQEAQLILLPGIADDWIDAPAYQAERMLDPLRELSQRLGIALAFPLVKTEPDGRKAKIFYLLDGGATLGTYRKAHLTEHESETFVAGDEIPVFDTPYGRIGMMLDEEGVLTEVPRSLMLQGVDLILWPARASHYPLLTVARSRADENKLFVALATPLEEDVTPHTALINPGGSFMAQALPDIEQGIAGQMAWLLTRFKEMAPNTNVVLNRLPEIYGRVFKAE